MYICKSIPLIISILLVFNKLTYSAVERPEPVIPPPTEVFWKKIKPSPYTMVIKSKRYGEFNFIQEAEGPLENYKRLCKIMGLRREIIDSIDVSYSKDGFVEVKCADPLFKTNIKQESGEKYPHIEIDYPYKDYMVRLVLDQKNNYRPLAAECITKYSMEIPAVALANKKMVIVDLIYPPRENTFLLSIDIDRICEYNMENLSLVEELKKPFLSPDQRDDVIQRIIANAIHHPLGKFCLIKKDNKIMILAEVLNQRVFLPVECINTPLYSIIQKNSLKRLFPGEDVTNISDKRIMELIYTITKNISSNGFIVVEQFPLRRDWYIITTPNTCYWTDYFLNYIEIQSKKIDIELKIPIHLHPWQQMQWLLETPEKYLLSEYQIYLVPSGKDIDLFKSRYHDSKLYIVLGRDLYSEELNWAVYDDISLIEKEIQGLEQSKGDLDKIKLMLKRIRDSRGTVQRYYTKKPKGLIIDREIDSLLDLNKRQVVILEKIKEYKNKYPWRLLNASFLVPILNEQLAKIGWKVVNSKEELGYSVSKKEFYYKDGTTSRMDIFLYILFKLCYIEANDLPTGLNREEHIVGVIKDICIQLDYLCIKYYHFEDFVRHMEYLSNIIRLNIWDREKAVLIAKEQINNGNYYLEKYNLGCYRNINMDDLRFISKASFTKEERVMELEDIIKGLSRKHDVKNVEEFTMEFEKQLILMILDNILGVADFS